MKQNIFIIFFTIICGFAYAAKPDPDVIIKDSVLPFFISYNQCFLRQCEISRVDYTDAKVRSVTYLDGGYEVDVGFELVCSTDVYAYFNLYSEVLPRDLKGTKSDLHSSVNFLRKNPVFADKVRHIEEALKKRWNAIHLIRIGKKGKSYYLSRQYTVNQYRGGWRIKEPDGKCTFEIEWDAIAAPNSLNDLVKRPILNIGSYEYIKAIASFFGLKTIKYDNGSKALLKELERDKEAYQTFYEKINEYNMTPEKVQTALRIFSETVKIDSQDIVNEVVYVEIIPDWSKGVKLLSFSDETLSLSYDERNYMVENQLKNTFSAIERNSGQNRCIVIGSSQQGTQGAGTLGAWQRAPFYKLVAKQSKDVYDEGENDFRF